MLDMNREPGHCKYSSQLMSSTINEVKDKSNEVEKVVVAEGATSLAYLGPLTSKSVTQHESEDEFTGDDVLELVTEQGCTPDYLYNMCMNTCSGGFSEVVASRVQLMLERPGCHASGYEQGSERHAWGEVAGTVAITPPNGGGHGDTSGRDLTAPLCVLYCLLVGLLLLLGPRRRRCLDGALRKCELRDCEPNAMGVMVVKVASSYTRK
jgi:hypothetical protein|tara:strand:+ start:153 stop:779 length:627 start_codon:yes stop_codon:yes gene_type:complete